MANSAFSDATHAANRHSDIAITSVASNDILKFDGTNWVNSNVMAGITSLTVDNININGNTISSTAGTDLLITPLGGQQIVLDGTIIIDAGVVTGATSITSTEFVGGGVGLTALNGSQITTGTVADARISALTASKLTGALPAISGANLTNLPAGGIASVAADTSPLLGGNLDVVTHILTSASNYNVRIQPAGYGDIVMAPNGITIGTGGSATKAPVQILCGSIISHRANCLELVGPTGNGLNEPARNGTSDSGGGGQLSITSSTLVTSGNTYGQNLGGRIVFGGKYHSGGYDTPFASIAGLKESNSQNGNADTAGYLSLYTREAADPWGMIERMKISSGGEVTVKENASMPSVTQGIAKGFVRFGSTANVIGTSYNVSAVSVSSSLFTISWSDDFTDGNYTVVGVTASGAARHGVLHAASAGSCEWLAFNSSGTEIGGDACIVAYGIRET